MCRILLRSLAVILVLVWSSPLTQAQNLPPEVVAYADWVLYNGKVLTANDQFTIAEAVAIRDGKFLAVGDTARILKMAGPNTRRVNLQGKTVTPGFYDTHFHLPTYALSGLSLPRIQWGDTVESGLKELAKLVEKTPAGEWIVASAGSMNPLVYGQMAVTREHLDSAAPNNPVSLQTAPSGFLLNSRALELADIPPGTPGVIKDPKTGKPNGHLRLWAAGVPRYELLPWFPLEKIIPPLKEAMSRYNAQGITMISTRVPGNEFTALREIWLNGEMTMRWRVNHEMTGQNPRLEKLLKRTGNLSGVGDDLFRIAGGFTSPPDGGAILPVEMWTVKPKVRLPEGTNVSPYGLGNWEDPDQSERNSAVLLARYGWTVLGMHSMGDRATTEVLKAYEEGKKNPIAPTKHQTLAVDHLAMVPPEQMKKMKELGVIPSVMITASILKMDQYAYLLGNEEAMKMSPSKSIIAAGLRPVAEADNGEFPYSSPLWNMEKYITRKDEQGFAWGRAQEGITRQQALWMYTNWAASYTGDEKKLGTIEPGKLADLVVLGGDYLTVPEEDISEIPVMLTLVGGKVVYDKGGL